MKVAKATGRLHGKQPKLNPGQDTHLVALHCTAPHRTAAHRTAAHSTAELGDLFGVGRSTVYRALERDAARHRASQHVG